MQLIISSMEKIAAAIRKPCRALKKMVFALKFMVFETGTILVRSANIVPDPAKSLIGIRKMAFFIKNIIPVLQYMAFILPIIFCHVLIFKFLISGYH